LSGRVLQPAGYCYCGRCQRTVSIPCLSGRVLQLATDGSILAAIYDPFQSPVCRGGFCNDARHELGQGIVVEFQSPVCRGGFCNDHCGKFLRNPLTQEFQSPVCRGGFCNPNFSPTTSSSLSSSFNPLFVGAGSATSAVVALPGHVVVKFQSPVCRGGFCNLGLSIA